MKRKILVVLFALLAFWLTLIVRCPAAAWAVPGQDPARQSIPTLTPTPGGGPSSPSGPARTALPPTPRSPPLIITYGARGTAAPRPRETWEWSGEGGLVPGPPVVETGPSVFVAPPAPSEPPRLEGQGAVGGVPLARRTTSGMRAVVDLVVVAMGLILLLSGLVLTRRRDVGHLPES